MRIRKRNFPRSRDNCCLHGDIADSASSDSTSADGVTRRPNPRNRRDAIFTPSRRNAISHRMVASEPVTDRLGPRSTPSQDRFGHVRGHPRSMTLWPACRKKGSETLALVHQVMSPRLFFFDQVVWDTVLKLKAEVGNSDLSSRQYAEALCLEPCADARTPPIGTNDIQSNKTASWRLAGAKAEASGGIIEGHLAEELSLATPAELVPKRISPSSREPGFQVRHQGHTYGRRLRPCPGLPACRNFPLTTAPHGSTC